MPSREQPSPRITEPLPNDFKNGILTAFHDEQDAVDFLSPSS
jgi:hypothetical protein